MANANHLIVMNLSIAEAPAHLFTLSPLLLFLSVWQLLQGCGRRASALHRRVKRKNQIPLGGKNLNSAGAAELVAGFIRDQPRPNSVGTLKLRVTGVPNQHCIEGEGKLAISGALP